MKRCIAFLFIYLLSYQADGQLKKKFSVGLMTGYHQENFQWSVAGNIHGENPDIYSELIWRNIGGPCVAGHLHWNPWRRLVLAADFDYAFITQGRVSDMDYLGNHRTVNSYEGHFAAHEGNVQAYHFHIGYPILHTHLVELIPSVGYSIQLQKLYMLDPGVGLNSTYATNWNGVSARLAAVFRLSAKWQLTNEFTAAQLTFHATANWNLVKTFQHPLSFEDKANGVGITDRISIDYRLSHHLMLHTGFGYTYQQTGKGVDRLYLANGAMPVTQFNGATRKAMQFTAGVQVGLGK
ncbi:hypothetical protein [Chitinophaga varians]|uniref:hypothetical protein n=1 Tax=Chitinophaga varians TaxID=2202339 RepID=UPI00165F674D|nr:hypothetical protein [Chitinophaga varians]MBC9913050.1 hypothetical protein [Chitinophaga varians]